MGVSARSRETERWKKESAERDQARFQRGISRIPESEEQDYKDKEIDSMSVSDDKLKYEFCKANLL